MFSKVFIFACFMVLINNVFCQNNNTNNNNNNNNNNNSTYCSLSSSDIKSTYQFDLCLDHKFYACYLNDNDNDDNGNSGSNSTSTSSSVSGGISGSISGSVSSGSNTNSTDNDNHHGKSSFSKYTTITFPNVNGILKAANCYYISNKCKNYNSLIVVECASNVTNGNNSNGNSCILLQSNNNNNNNNNKLKCNVIFNATKKEYLYAFIAVVILVIFFFCCCPVFCLLYFCRYHRGVETFPKYTFKRKNKKVANTNTNNECEVSTSNNNNISNNNNNNSERVALFGKNTKVTTCIATQSEVEAQPMYTTETQPMYNTSCMGGSNKKNCDTNTNDEIVV